MKLREMFRKNAKYDSLLEQEDDEDLSPAERALIAKADTDLKAKGVKVRDFDPDKMVGKSNKPSDDEDETPARSAKKPVGKTSKPANDSSAPKKDRGDGAVIARKYLQDNPDVKRRQFVAYMVTQGTGEAYASTMYYKYQNKKEVSELFYITNDKGQVLAEGDVWTVFEDYSKRLMMFKNEWNATRKALKTGGKVKRSKV